MIKNHSGVILNISSMWGQVGASCEVHYSASKAGVIGLTKGLAKEVGLSGVRVNCICPGVIMTDMMKGFDEQTVQELKRKLRLICSVCPMILPKLLCFSAAIGQGSSRDRLSV